MKVPVVCAALWLSVLPAAAQGIDCFKTSNPVQKTICTDSTLTALDKAMVTAYNAAIRQAAPALKTEIEAQQRRWAIARDACTKDKDLKRCVESYYANRTTELNAYAKGERPISPNVHSFECADKTTVVVEFVGGAKPYAVVTHGASKWTLPQVRTASGARFANDKVSIWSRGKNITFDVAGKSQTCTER